MKIRAQAKELAFSEFVDALQTADDEASFTTVASRLARDLGFRWFAYLRPDCPSMTIVSSYPTAWIRRYFQLNYQQVDPVVSRARLENDLFNWTSSHVKAVGSREQRRFFDEAMGFGIASGITVPIRCGFGRVAAFTISSDERSQRFSAKETKAIVQLAGLYFHTHLIKSLAAKPGRTCNVLGQRERQCLAWVAQGKVVVDIAVLMNISPRTVTFHLESARRKLNAVSIAHCVAEALRRHLLS